MFIDEGIAGKVVKGVLVLVDECDIDLLEKVNTFSNGYPMSGQYKLHSVIAKRAQLKGDTIDHVNRCRWDNRRLNLRVATRQQQTWNTKPNGDIDYKGVSKISPCTGGRKKWRARITVNGVGVYLGLFYTPEQAALAYDKAALEHFGQYAVLNFPHCALIENSSPTKMQA